MKRARPTLRAYHAVLATRSAVTRALAHCRTTQTELMEAERSAPPLEQGNAALAVHLADVELAAANLAHEAARRRELAAVLHGRKAE